MFPQHQIASNVYETNSVPIFVVVKEGKMATNVMGRNPCIKDIFLVSIKKICCVHVYFVDVGLSMYR